MTGVRLPQKFLRHLHIHAHCSQVRCQRGTEVVPVDLLAQGARASVGRMLIFSRLPGLSCLVPLSLIDGKRKVFASCMYVALTRAERLSPCQVRQKQAILFRKRTAWASRKKLRMVSDNSAALLKTVEVCPDRA
jgi:hypothetical protein